MPDIEKTVIECAAEVYQVDASMISLDTIVREELSNQSLLLVAFISSIEDALDAEIDLGESMKLLTIRDFAEEAKKLSK